MKRDSIGQQRKDQVEDPLEMQVGKMVETLRPLCLRHGVTQNHLAAARRGDKIADRINAAVADLYLEKGAYPFESDKKLLSLIKRSEYAGLRDWHNLMGLELSEADVKLPKNIKSRLYSPCPFVANRMKIETHFLCCFPHSFDGRDVSVDGTVVWGDVAARKEGPSPLMIRPKNRETEVIRSSRLEGNRWFLIFRGLIPGSYNLSRQEQTDLMPKGYRFAKLMEVAFGLGFYSFKHPGMELKERFHGATAGTVSGRIYEVSYSAELKPFGAEYAFCRNMGGSSSVGAFAVMEL
jgi:hypothetical protein